MSIQWQKLLRFIYRVGDLINDGLKSLCLQLVYYITQIYKSIMLFIRFIFWALISYKSKEKLKFKPKQSNPSICSWYAKIKKVAYQIFKNMTHGKIGRPRQVVQIDECIFSKCKYNIGRLYRKILDGWGFVFGNSSVFSLKHFIRLKML